MELDIKADRKLLNSLWARSVLILYVVDTPLSPCPVDRSRTIDSFSDFECKSKFRFTKQDLKRLCQLLKFDNKNFIISRKQNKMAGFGD